jgi:hypothetical protein
MQQWERYRMWVRHRRSTGDVPEDWIDEVRTFERQLGIDGWYLVSTNAFFDRQQGLVEILWFQRLITPDSPPRPPERPLGFDA